MAENPIHTPEQYRAAFLADLATQSAADPGMSLVLPPKSGVLKLIERNGDLDFVKKYLSSLHGLEELFQLPDWESEVIRWIGMTDKSMESLEGLRRYFNFINQRHSEGVPPETFGLKVGSRRGNKFPEVVRLSTGISIIAEGYLPIVDSRLNQKVIKDLCDLGIGTTPLEIVAEADEFESFEADAPLFRKYYGLDVQIIPGF